MTAFHFPRSFAWRILAVAILVSVGSVGAVAGWGLHVASSETGPLETGQLAVLVATSILFALCACADRGAGRMAATAAAIGALVLALREVEVPVSGPISAYLHSSSFRIHETLLLGVPMLGYAVMRPTYVRDILRYAMAFGAWPVLPALAFLLLGGAFDGHFSLYGVPYLPTVLEETFELIGYSICLLAAIQVAVNRQHRDVRALTVANPA